ncbi:MAG TPA: TetR/AcrR family transcriptional regulator C-terminal domain-containing protein [Streptosporangiales bacterium]
MPDDPLATLIWNQPPPPGRRGSLDRDTIVRAAIELADEGGAAAVTMSGVAGRLGSYTPMALYRYVVGKDGLVDLMLDAVTAEIDLPDAPSRDWRQDLRGLAERTWQVIRAHPWYAQLFHTRPPAGPNVMRRTEFALAVLTAAGVPVAQALGYASLVDRYVFGEGIQVAEEERMRARYGLDDAAAFLAAVAGMRELADAGGRYPLLASWLAAPEAASADEQFGLGLECLLDGIAARLPSRGGVPHTTP